MKLHESWINEAPSKKIPQKNHDTSIYKSRHRSITQASASQKHRRRTWWSTSCHTSIGIDNCRSGHPNGTVRYRTILSYLDTYDVRDHGAWKSTLIHWFNKKTLHWAIKEHKPTVDVFTRFYTSQVVSPISEPSTVFSVFTSDGRNYLGPRLLMLLDQVLLWINGHLVTKWQLGLAVHAKNWGPQKAVARARDMAFGAGSCCCTASTLSKPTTKGETPRRRKCLKHHYVMRPTLKI